jgi:predicted ATPase
VTFATSVSTGSRTSWPPNASTNWGGRDFPPLRSLARTNLPVAAWPLLGRERELAEIRTLVADGVRLLNLTGPGGSGKTRLALQAAAEFSDEFRDGTFFVPLASLRETSAVRSTVAESVGLQADDDVAGWLASRRVLLVLDNLEHLEGVAAVVAELLVGEVVVLATSRAPLHLIAERELPVEPLLDDAAAELFVSRAAAGRRQIAVDETVTAVCRRLDNLPLAIELAAARVKLLSPATLLQRLADALPLLGSGAIDLPERQRTLRATIEWSYNLLDSDAQAAFRRLSVFRGSFGLDAAEAITGAELDQLAALLDHSLLKALGDERFFLLETLREYARERLDEAGETSEYALRHARWYLDRLQANYSYRHGPRRAEVLAWYEAEQDNLRAMLDRLDASAPIDAAHTPATFSMPSGLRRAPTRRSTSGCEGCSRAAAFPISRGLSSSSVSPTSLRGWAWWKRQRPQIRRRWCLPSPARIPTGWLSSVSPWRLFVVATRRRRFSLAGTRSRRQKRSTTCRGSVRSRTWRTSFWAPTASMRHGSSLSDW